MSVLTEVGDEIRGERIRCYYRKGSKEFLVAGSSAHRAKTVVIHGLPAVAIVEKPIRLK